MYMMPLFAFISLKLLIVIFKVAIGLGFVIFVHELGHFLVAKLCGVKCEKFYVGFDVPIKIGPITLPRVLFRKQWGETEYGIGIIPLGGYVKMLGQDDNPANTAKEAERIRLARENADGEDGTVQIDPRSYPAKTVLQRFLIISAGVVMNLIFAVIFGTIAYRMGVSYTPTIVGSASPGLSAWQIGLETGDKILQMGRDGKRSPHLRFDKDMRVKVMMTGPGTELDLLVDRYDKQKHQVSQPVWMTAKLSPPQKQYLGHPLIGISPIRTTTVGEMKTFADYFKHLPRTRTVVDRLQDTDEIVSVDGQPVKDYVQLSRHLAQKVDRDITLTIRRPGDDGQSTFDMVLPKSPVRWLGLNMEIGPVVAIQNNSAAQHAGLQEGDRIVAVNGDPIGNPLTLPERLRQLAGQRVGITIQRESSPEPITVEALLRRPTMLNLGASEDKPIAADALGVAYTVQNVVASVEPGSPAAKHGISTGDVIKQVEFLPSSENAAEIEQKFYRRPKPFSLEEYKNGWPWVQERCQYSLPDTKVKLSFERQGAIKTAVLTPVDSSQWYVEDRGISYLLSPAKGVHKVEDWGEAFALGFRETRESTAQVYILLSRLLTGKVSALNLGGPATIATVAGMEASESTSRLLIFLTLLSANLAVVNFLPIPVLDGGHAMFLLYEGVFRRPVNERVAFGLTMIGFCFILGLMIFVIGLDVWRLSGLAG